MRKLIFGLMVLASCTTQKVVETEPKPVKPKAYQPDRTNLERSLYLEK